MNYDDQSHKELGEMLKERGLSVPRSKDERIAALIWDDNTESEATTAETTSGNAFQERFPWATLPVIAVAVMLIIGGSVTAILFGDTLSLIHI